MNRSLAILLGALALGAAIVAGSYFASQRATEICCANPADDLSWLRAEFHLDALEMARIRELHEGYLPKCAEMCAKIAAKKGELEAALGSGTNINPEAQVKLNELAALRAQCQAQMLQHFATVKEWDEDFFAKNGTFKFMKPEDIVRVGEADSPSSSYLPVAYTGMGWMMIRKGVVETIKYPWFHSELQIVGPLIDMNAEDVSFCRALQAAGHTIHVDTKIRVGHQKLMLI